MKVRELRDKLQHFITVLEDYDDEDRVNIVGNTYFLGNTRFFVGIAGYDGGYVSEDDPVIDDDEEAEESVKNLSFSDALVEECAATTLSELKTKLAALEEKKFNIDMIDHWTREDYEAYNETVNEIDYVKKQILELGGTLDEGKIKDFFARKKQAKTQQTASPAVTNKQSQDPDAEKHNNLKVKKETIIREHPYKATQNSAVQQVFDKIDIKYRELEKKLETTHLKYDYYIWYWLDFHALMSKKTEVFITTSFEKRLNDFTDKFHTMPDFNNTRKILYLACLDAFDIGKDPTVKDSPFSGEDYWQYIDVVYSFWQEGNKSSYGSYGKLFKLDLRTMTFTDYPDLAKDENIADKMQELGKQD